MENYAFDENDEYLKQKESMKKNELNEDIDVNVIHNIDPNLLRIVRKWRDDGRPSKYFCKNPMTILIQHLSKLIVS